MMLKALGESFEPLILHAVQTISVEITDDQVILTADQVILTDDQVILTADQVILTADQVILTADQVILTADQNRISQTISNLISNTTKYAGQGTHIKLEANATDSVFSVYVTAMGLVWTVRPLKTTSISIYVQKTL